MRVGALVLIVAAALVAGFFGTGTILDRFLGQDVDAQDRAGSAEEATLVTAAVPRMRTIRDAFDAVGTVIPIRSIDVRALVEGRVTEVRFTPGEAVEEGALLFALDDRAERAALSEAQATLEQTQSEYRRAEELVDRDVASEAIFESARAAFLRAQASVQQAENALEDTTVEAPFSGVLGLADLDPGERVDPDTIVTTLDDLSSVQVEFSVPERYFTQVEEGQRVVLSGAAYGMRTFEGTVSAIAPRIAEGSRSFAVRAMVPNEERALAGGMFMNVSLVFDERRALTLPEDAIISEGDATYVFVLNGDAAERREIAIGGRAEGDVEVVEGIAAETQVVTSGYDALEDGALVRQREEQVGAEG